MTAHVTVVAPSPTAARRYAHSLHVLTDAQTREYVIGLAVLAAEAGGYDRPKEGETVRLLLDDAITRAYRQDKAAYERAVLAGRAELERRRQQ